MILYTHNKKRMHELRLGVCKSDGCWYGRHRKQVPYRLWEYSDGRYVCPRCGYGVAPEDVYIDTDTWHFGIPETWYKKGNGVYEVESSMAADIKKTIQGASK